MTAETEKSKGLFDNNISQKHGFTVFYNCHDNTIVLASSKNTMVWETLFEYNIINMVLGKNYPCHENFGLDWTFQYSKYHGI